MIRVGSDFSGVGAFNQALMRLGIEYKEVFACDMDKYARQTFIHNYGEPEYYPTNVYEREIPSESLDIYVSSPPCQAFSLAGKRLGKDDKRGILFFNSHEFIQVNKPRYFIFENVKGLLSDDGGKTFSEWVNMLGGKSVNGVPVLFPEEDSVPYHLYWKVINAQEHGIPQNRERIFLIGIRDDKDNNFRFPIEEHLTKRLKDILEENVDKKYFLSDKMIAGFEKHNENHKKKETGFIFKPKDGDDVANCLRSNAALCPTDNSIKIKSTSKGYEEATEGERIQIVDYRTDEGFRWRADGNSPAIMAMMRDTWKENFTGQNPPIIKYNDKRLNETVLKDSIAPCLHGFEHGTNGQFNKQLLNKGLIRRLTPRECFRLMDFPDTFTWPVSDSQAYKQAGNSIVVNVLYKIIKNLNL